MKAADYIIEAEAVSMFFSEGPVRYQKPQENE
jgi:hypothetical protein